MAIRRPPLPVDRYVIIDNAWLRDPALSYRAKGILAYIATHAPGHELTVDQIITEGTEGREAVRAALGELEAAGYLARFQRRVDGRIVGTDFELRDPTSAQKPVTGSDQHVCGVCAAQTSAQETGDGNLPPKKTTSQKTQKTTSASPRGTRLPEGWLPSDELKIWARDNAPGIGWVEHEKFVDYFKSAPGQKGVKLDWPATWRNWMRRAAEQHGNRPTSGAPSGAQFKSSAEQNIDRQKVRQARARVLDAIMEAGLSLDEAKDQVKDWSDGDFLKRVAPSTVPGYIDGDVIDSTQRPEVES